MTQYETKKAAKAAVLRLIERVANGITANAAINTGMDAGDLFKGCAAVLRAMDEITVIDE